MAIDGESTNSGGEERGENVAAFDSVAMLGVHVIADPDPAAAAQRMAAADDIEVELVADLTHAQAAFTARAEAGRTPVVVIGERERAELEASAATPLSHAAPTPEAIAEIRQLAEELRRIDRIRRRTEDRFTEMLSERLAAGSGLVLHPDTLRAAGRVVVDVEEEIAELEREMGDLTDPVVATSDATQSTDNPRRARKRRRSTASTLAAVGIALIAVGVAIGVVAVGANPAIAGAIAVVGLLVAVAVWRGRRDRRSRRSAAVTEAPAASRRTPEEEHARLVARARVQNNLERAQERQRSAVRHWDSLAGPDADPHDIEAVLRLRDPQYVVGATAARASPTMRTVNAVHRRSLARWRVAWAAVGYDTAPAPADVEDALRVLVARPATDPAAAWARLAAADAWTQAGNTIDRTLVLVEPKRWVPQEDLESLIAMLPAGAEVVVLDR